MLLGFKTASLPLIMKPIASAKRRRKFGFWFCTGWWAWWKDVVQLQMSVALNVNWIASLDWNFSTFTLLFGFVHGLLSMSSIYIWLFYTFELAAGDVDSLWYAEPSSDQEFPSMTRANITAHIHVSVSMHPTVRGVVGYSVEYLLRFLEIPRYTKVSFCLTHDCKMSLRTQDAATELLKFQMNAANEKSLRSRALHHTKNTVMFKRGSSDCWTGKFRTHTLYLGYRYHMIWNFVWVNCRSQSWCTAHRGVEWDNGPLHQKQTWNFWVVHGTLEIGQAACLKLSGFCFPAPETAFSICLDQELVRNSVCMFFQRNTPPSMTQYCGPC